MKPFFLIFIFLIFISCQKSGGASVEGTVFTEHYHVAVPYATVTILESHRHNQGNPIQSTKADSDGHFKIKYFKNQLYEYSIVARSETHGFSFEKRLDDKTSSINIELTGNVVIVRFRVKNTLSEDVDLFIGSDVVTASIKSNSEKLLDRIYSIKDYGTSTFTWYYKKHSSYEPSAHKSEPITLNSPIDTIYRELEIN